MPKRPLNHAESGYGTTCHEKHPKTNAVLLILHNCRSVMAFHLTCWLSRIEIPTMELMHDAVKCRQIESICTETDISLLKWNHVMQGGSSGSPLFIFEKLLPTWTYNMYNFTGPNKHNQKLFKLAKR